MIYISTLNLASGLRQSVLQTETSMAKAQKELNTGVYADIGLQLGGTTASAISLSQQSDRLTALKASNTTATTRLSSTTSAIDTIAAAAKSMSNLMLSNASGGTLSATIQAQAKASLQSMLGTLNTSVDGHFIFAGTNTGNAPMVDGATATSTTQTALAADLAGLNPDASQISAAQISSYLDDPAQSFNKLFGGSDWSQLSSASDTPIKSQISTSETATTSVSASQAAFKTILQAYSMLSGLAGRSLSNEASAAVVTKATSLLSQGVTGLTAIEAGIGVTQNSISAANDQMAAQQTILTNNVSDLTSVDTYTLSTRITSLQTALQDTYSLTSQLKSLSLVNYLTAG